MALPGHRHTSSKTRRRRSHLALKNKKLAFCANCKRPILSHQVCPNCGFYKGRLVIDVLAKLDKKERKKKEKEMAVQEKEIKNKPLSLEALSRK